jgi:hypothetical protein
MFHSFFYSVFPLNRSCFCNCSLQLVDDIAILRIANGSDLFCIVNAALTADTCAQVCSAYARAGNRQSDVAAPSNTLLPASPARLTSGVIKKRQTELTMDGVTLKISHSSPVPRDEDEDAED